MISMLVSIDFHRSYGLLFYYDLLFSYFIIIVYDLIYICMMYNFNIFDIIMVDLIRSKRKLRNII